MRVFGRLGIRAAILTNAAGGINLNFKQGALVVIRDHINLQGTNPLIGPNDERFGPRFPDMTQAYWKPYREIALAEAKRLGIEVPRGRVCGAFRTELRNARGNSLFAHDWRRSGGHVHGAGSDRRAPHGNSRAGNFLRHEYGRGNSGSAARSHRSNGNRRAGEGPVHRAAARGVAAHAAIDTKVT